MKKRILAMALLLGGCGDDGASTVVDAALTFDAPPPAADAEAACDKRWTTLRKGTSTSYLIESGSLTMNAIGPDALESYTLFQTGMLGDFTATLNFANFDVGGAGGYVQGIVSADAATDFYAAGLGNLTPDGPGLQLGAAHVDTVTTGDWQATALTSGIITLARTGDTVTVTATDGTITATQAGTFAHGTLNLGMQVGNNHPTDGIAGTVSVDFIQFAIDDETGAIQSDTFDCNSVLPAS